MTRVHKLNVRPLATAILTACATFAATSLAPAEAADVVVVKSPGGITARLMEVPGAQLVSMSMLFRGGSTQDPVDKPGVAAFVNCMFNEGAGALRSQELMQRLYIEESVQFDRTPQAESHAFGVTVVKPNLEAGMALVGGMFQEPRYDEDAVGRCRDEMRAGVNALEADAGTQQGRALARLLYGEHPVGRQLAGTKESVEKIAVADLIEYRRRVFARENMMIAVVGGIDAASLGVLLDRTFGRLPEKADLRALPPLPTPEVGVKVLDYDVPQASIVFASAVKLTTGRERAAADVINLVLGGGHMESRLMQEIREKRGLAYGVSTARSSLTGSDYFSGSAAVDNEKAGEVIPLIRAELAKVARDGLSAEEIADAKSMLKGQQMIGSRLNGAIAGRLSADWYWGAPADYFAKFEQRIDAVTADDVREVARRMLKPDALSIVVVGRNVKL